MLENAFIRVLDMSKTASIVIAVVLVARLLLKKAPKWISYALWAVVLLRLICPFSIEAPISVVPPMETVSAEIVDAALPKFEFETITDQQINQQIVATTPQDMPYTQVGRSLEPTQWLSAIWLVGIAVMLIYSAVSYIKLRRRLVEAALLRGNIYLADRISSPFVMGVVRPKIYMPSDIGESEREYIILHEQCHIRRFDHIVKVLGFAALCVHWFNPLAWLAFVLAGKDMEMSCDEAVIETLGSEIRADYSASLLGLATGRRLIAGIPLAFGEGDTRGRIRNLAKWKKPVVWVVIIAVVICAVLAMCLLTDPVDKGDLLIAKTREHGAEFSAVYEMELGKAVKSGSVVAEIWANGECRQSIPVSFTAEDTELGISMRLRKEDTKYVGVEIEVDPAPSAGSLITYFPIPEYGEYIGWSTTAYEPKKKVAVKPDEAEVIAAMAFDLGNGVRSMDCQSLTEEPWRLKEYDCIITILAGFSDEEVPTQQVTLAKPEPPVEVLQLHHVIKLAEKGYELGWEDFEDFYFIETRPGLYVREYEIDKTFALSIEGKSPNGGTEPIHIYLCANGLDERIDIRDGGVKEFIAKHSGKFDEVLTLDDSCIGAMRAMRVEWISLISGGNNEDEELWAKTMNDAADNVVERGKSGKYFWNVDVYCDTEETFRFYAGLEENIVMMYYHWDKAAYGTYFFEDKALYELIRGSFTYEGVIDEKSLAEYGGIVEARVESIIRDYNRNGYGKLDGYEYTEFCKHDSFKDSGFEYTVYRLNIAFSTENPEDVVWAGGMWLDSKLRVRDYDLYTYLVVRTINGELIDYRFMPYDIYTGAGTDEERSRAWNEIQLQWENT